jgi:hypothetical protein
MRHFLALAATLFVLAAQSVVAADFRIETKVYVADDEEEPISENLTLFQTGVVYDFLSKPETITIFRPPAGNTPGRFIVLDPARSVKMEVTTEQIETLLEKLRDMAAKHEDPYVRFLGQPEFTEGESEEMDTVVLTSKYMTYRVHTAKAADDASLAAYRQFSDWYARFNTRGGVLPFPRLAVNEALFRQRLIPTEVELQIPGQGVNLRAVHRTGWLLSKQDRQRIDEAQEQVGSFRQVPLDEFVREVDESRLQ